MSIAPILSLRKAVVTHLRADSSVTGTSVGSRIYGEKAPAPDKLVWPFARYGISDAVPGHEIDAPIHVFSKAEFTDDVNAITEAISLSLDGAVLSLSDGRDAYVHWSGTRIVANDAQEWHAIVGFKATIPRGCS
jgi:hypothetical protein